MDINDARKQLILSANNALEQNYDPFEMVVVEEKSPTIEMVPVLDGDSFASLTQIRLRVSVEMRLRHKTREEQEQSQKDHSELFKNQGELEDAMRNAVKDSGQDRDRKRHEFHVRLTELINEIGLEVESETPDFLISDYLVDCLETYERVVARRTAWRGEQI